MSCRGFEAIAQAVVSTLEQLPAAGLVEEDLREAEATADEVPTEVTRPEPDRGRIRRAVTALRGSSPRWLLCCPSAPARVRRSGPAPPSSSTRSQ
jgi:hypothetical protein